MDEVVHTNRARAESFGAIAEEYDRYRTSYPDALFADLVDLTPARVLDVACGTGKVAVPLLACGLGVLGVEPDPKMAEVARSHGIIVEVGAFETWDDRDRTFGLITCGQGWHWIDPQLGAAKAAKVLEPGGTLALFWSYPEFSARLSTSFEAAYETHAPELHGASASTSRSRKDDALHRDTLEASGHFASVETRTYRWTRSFTTEQWVRRSATFSDHLLLPDEQRARLLDALGEIVDAEGGTIDVEFGTYTVLATTPES